MSEIVYVLTNSAMPGLVKIGRTTRESPEVRMNELYRHAGVPVPFECAYAIRVEDSSKVERALHEAFGNQRPNPDREFFEIGDDSEEGVYRVRAILELLTKQFDAEEVTLQVNKESESLTKEEQASSEKLKNKKIRRPSLNFDKMGVPRGAELVFAPYGGEKTDRVAKVIGAKKVLFEDEEMSLTQATRRALGSKWTQNLTTHWYCEGRLLKNIWSQWADGVMREVYESGDDTDE